jgi:hypothetical protein
MLFDLKGKRRRAVQVTYLGLAILIGLGLVGFGVGSSVNGGLGDLFSGGSGSNTANQTIQKQVDAANRRLRLNPHDQAALKQLIRSHYQLATSDANSTTGAFTTKGKQQLGQAAAAWNRYLAQTPNPDPAVAGMMFQAFGVQGLDRPEDATKTAEIVAAAQPTAQAYLIVIEYGSLARDTRAVDLATKRALALTPAGQRATVTKQISQAKAAGTAAAAQATVSPAQP